MSSDREFTRDCAACDATFVARRKVQIYCSHECSHLASAGRRLERKRSGAKAHDRTAVTPEWRAYLWEFESKLRSPDGVVIAMQIADGLGVALNRTRKK